MATTARAARAFLTQGEGTDLLLILLANLTTTPPPPANRNASDRLLT
jgi:hypothetical protein